MVDPAVSYQKIRQVTLLSALTNSALAVIKIWCGIFGQSPALITDGIHSLSDLLCDGLVLIAAKFSHADADHNHPYGHRRIETFTTLGLGVFLIILGLGIAYEALMHIVNQTTVRPDAYTAIAATISIVANELLFRYSFTVGKRINSTMLKANAWHNRSDALSSLIVLLGILGALAGWTFLDAIAAILVALLITKMGIKWGVGAVYELTDAGLDDEKLAVLRAKMIAIDGVLSMHQLRTRKMADQILLDVHVCIRPYLSASEGHHIGEQVRMVIHQVDRKITDITVHIDTENHSESIPTALPPTRKQITDQLLQYLDKSISRQDILGVTLYYQHQQAYIEPRLRLSLLEVKSHQVLYQLFEQATNHLPQVVLSNLCYTDCAITIPSVS